MKNYRHFVKSKSRYLVSGGYFLIAAFILQLILPGEPHFKYEYQKGSPWKHNNLVAPFDFAIQKSAKDIESEKTALLKSIAPYFRTDTSVSLAMTKKFRIDLAKMLDGTSGRKEFVFRELTYLVDSVYKKGVLLKSPESFDELKGKTEIMKIEGVIVTKIPVTELFSERSAYNIISIKIASFKKTIPALGGQLSAIDPAAYISANLLYDKETTEKEYSRASETISTSRGMVQAGERIILQGEIVDENSFQILESLKVSYEKKQGLGINRIIVAVGKFLFILILLTLLFIFLHFHRTDILNETKKLMFVLSFIATMVGLAILIQKYEGLHIYLLPMAILPLVIRTFFDSRTAIFTLVVTSLLIGYFAPNNYEYVLIQVVAGIIGVFSLDKMHRRVHMIKAAFFVLITYLIVFTALSLIQEGTLLGYNYLIIKWFAFSSGLISLVYPLIYIFEKLFGFTSDVTLIELSDTNQPLLRQLSEQAPGTFQHSMQIANLAEEIILQIGGNPFLVRAGALYHDIGKVTQPGYFIENQMIGMNPHDKLNNLKSAEVIIDHVINGVAMARKQKLPESLIEFIATHHGTTKTKYFLLKYQQENPGTNINLQQFAYPGPLPRSKEASVVMIVDGIEAASRSLKDKTTENLEVLIDDMVEQKLKEHQLDESELTFSDISKIKEILLNKLLNIYHIRIEYPKG
jgi:cyclic-di-AMP phosphodiesterase PgpH